HFSRAAGTPMTIIRLNYAVEMRYGVLVDLAQQVRRGDAVSLSVGYANVIWQRDACDWILRSLALAESPPRLLNIAGAQAASCRGVCEAFGEAFGCDVQFANDEGPSALLSDAARANELFGPPQIGLDELVEQTAKWLLEGGPTWDKPTLFERIDGVF
ncbi:MAG: epimerase, partial [Planctomycetota bacterium]